MAEITTGPALVESVVKGSPADKAGIKAKDKILRIDGSTMRDVIDFSILMETDVIHDLDVERSGKTTIRRIEIMGEEHGIRLGNTVFDRLKLCNNDCIFCFVDQLPSGLRKTFYVKDDDYRMSFLEGNFITLTNLTVTDIERIIEDKLSPLYVSLHAFEPHLRERIFNNPQAAGVIATLELLLNGGIGIHVQVVLIKGINDGLNLDDTIGRLVALHPGILSIGIVPVGTTSVGRKRLPEDYIFDRESSLRLIQQVDSWREKSYSTGIYIADEFYFLAGKSPPESPYYAEFPQAENGIGLARLFIDEFNEAMNLIKVPLVLEGKAVVTSPMGAWVLDRIGIDDRCVQREICENTLFGDTVNVCGLLPGRDIERCLVKTTGASAVLIPGISMTGGVFIDGVKLEEISKATGQNLCSAGVSGGDLVHLLSTADWSR